MQSSSKLLVKNPKPSYTQDDSILHDYILRDSILHDYILRDSTLHDYILRDSILEFILKFSPTLVIPRSKALPTKALPPKPLPTKPLPAKLQL